MADLFPSFVSLIIKETGVYCEASWLVYTRTGNLKQY